MTSYKSSQYKSPGNFNGNTKTLEEKTHKMSRVFNQRFRQRTLRSEIKEYDKIKDDANKLTLKLNKFVTKSKHDQLSKIRAMQEQIKKQ